MSNEIKFTYSKIILKLSDPADWLFASKLTGKVEDIAPGVFEYALSTQNMQRIAKWLTGPRKPVVTGGQQYLDSLKDRLSRYKAAKETTQQIASQERYPVPPNGKFIPYSHQTKIVGAILNNPYTATFADCGLGKTGSYGRAIELCLANGEVRKGRILVSAPLSILHTSWFDDLGKFTSLKASILWTPLSNKTILGEEKKIIGNYGEKPEGTITTKTKTGVCYVQTSSGRVLERPTSLDGNDWVKHLANYKVAIDLEGCETPFGPIRARTASTEKTREAFIRSELARTDVDVYLTNHDSVRIYEGIFKEFDLDWLIIDESTKIKSPRSKVARAHVNISWRCKRRSILSGTPNPNGFLDLFQQFYFLDRGLTLEPSYKDFLNEYFKPIRVGYVKTPGGNKEAIKYEIRGEKEKEALITRVRNASSFFEQRDCIDLPPRTDTRRVAYMTAEQEEAYDRMERDLIAELTSQDGRRVGAEAVNVLSKIMKLRQITSGFLLGKDGEVAHLTSNPKWEDLDDYIEELGDKKIVIAAQFREEISCLVRRYSGIGAKAINGDVAVPERARIIRDFQENPTCRIVILQPAAAAHGITLTAANHLVFASLDYNFEYYYQTAKRIERLGQRWPIFVGHILAKYRDGTETIDWDLMDVMVTKNSDRNALFNPSSQSSVEEIAEHLTKKLIQRVRNRNG